MRPTLWHYNYTNNPKWFPITLAPFEIMNENDTTNDDTYELRWVLQHRNNIGHIAPLQEKRLDPRLIYIGTKI